MTVSANLLRAFPLFRQSAETTLEAVSLAASVVMAEQGDYLFRAGDVPVQACLLVRGLVDVTRLTATGEEVGLALFGPRELPGLFAIMEGKAFPASARILSADAQVLRIERSALLRASEQDPSVARALSDVLGHHAKILREKVDVLTAGDVPQRLATLFLVLEQRFGDEGDDGSMTVPLTLTRRVLARLVGARVETVIRVLSKWEKESFVTTTEDGFSIKSSARLRREASTPHP